MIDTDERLDLVKDVVDSLTYKPNSWLRMDGGELIISDSYVDVDTGIATNFDWIGGRPPQEALDAPDDTEVRRLVIDWVWEQCALAELHEVGEWLQVDGQPVYNPHSLVEGCPVKVSLAFPECKALAMKHIP